MTFKRVFRGYDPKQVDAYLKSKTESDNMVLQAQRERVDQLVDENNRMKAQIAKYKADEQSISQALIQSQHLATKMQNDADKYAEVVLTRAKLFYAAWQAYAQTLVTSLSTQELAQFNKIKEKLEKLVYAYDGRNINAETADLVVGARHANNVASAQAQQPQKPVAETKPANPIKRVEQASGQSIDLKELVHPEQSLSEICEELGLKGGTSEIELDIPRGED